MNACQTAPGPVSPQSWFMDSSWGAGVITVRPIQAATARSVVYPTYHASLNSLVVPDLAAAGTRVAGWTAPFRMSVRM